MSNYRGLCDTVVENIEGRKDGSNTFVCNPFLHTLMKEVLSISTDIHFSLFMITFLKRFDCSIVTFRPTALSFPPVTTQSQ